MTYRALASFAALGALVLASTACSPPPSTMDGSTDAPAVDAPRTDAPATDASDGSPGHDAALDAPPSDGEAPDASPDATATDATPLDASMDAAMDAARDAMATDAASTDAARDVVASDGAACAPGQVVCRGACVPTPAMACDDGNDTAGDGCSRCNVEPGWSYMGAPSVCATVCGDGIRAGAELCDDGNGTNGDGCDNDCRGGVCVVGAGYATIQAAASAAACRYIRVPTGVYHEHVNLSHPVELFGDSTSGTVIDGSSSAGSTVDMSTIGAYTLRSLTIRGGHSGAGGGLVAGGGSVVLDAVHVTGNTADHYGGGVLFMPGSAAGSQLTVRNGSVIDANQAADNGGGIYSTGNVRIEGGSHVSNNTVAQSACAGCGAMGGGIRVQRPASGAAGAIVVDDSFVENNHVTIDLTVATATSAFGGGIEAEGDLTLTDGAAVRGNTVRVTSTMAACFASGGGAYVNGALTIAQSDVSGNTMTLTCAGMSLGNGGGIAYEGPSSSTVVALTDATVRANTVTVTGGSSVGAAGGGISVNRGTTRALRSAIEGNVALAMLPSGTASNARGGGIDSNDLVSLTQCTVADNRADAAGAVGGGVYLALSAGFVLPQLVNSTLSGNEARGAMSQGGGAWIQGQTLTIASSTVSNNRAGTSGGGLAGSGSSTSVVSVQDSIVAGNTAPASPDWLCTSGGVYSLGYNVVGSAAGCAVTGSTTGNQLGADPMLGALANNGGETRTQMPAAGSPVIDAGDPAGCSDGAGGRLTVDQRGAPRTGRCDVGAVER